jgi:hypothetical protein
MLLRFALASQYESNYFHANNVPGLLKEGCYFSEKEAVIRPSSVDEEKEEEESVVGESVSAALDSNSVALLPKRNIEKGLQALSGTKVVSGTQVVSGTKVAKFPANFDTDSQVRWKYLNGFCSRLLKE